MRLPTLLLVLAACLLVDVAHAHAHLEKSTPADGSTLTGTVDSSSLAPTGDEESDNYVLSVQGTLYNADGSIFGTYDAELTGQLTDSGSLVITSGTLTETQ